MRLRSAAFTAAWLLPVALSGGTTIELMLVMSSVRSAVLACP